MKRANVIIVIALFLTACIAVLPSLCDQYEAHALTGSFTVLPYTPTPTPTPTPEPTASHHDTDLTLIVNMIGKITEWLRDENGMLLEDVTSPSRDQRVILHIGKGTIALGPDSQPLSHISTGVVDPFTKSPPLNLPARSYFIDVLEFAPSGATFSGQAYIEICYEDTDIPEGLNESELKIIQLDSNTGEWEFIPCLIAQDTNTITFSINHFSIYAFIVFPVPESLENIPGLSNATSLSPGTVQSTVTSNFIWVIILLAIEFIILDIILVISLRRQKRSFRN